MKIRHKQSPLSTLQTTYDFLEPFLNKEWESQKLVAIVALASLVTDFSHCAEPLDMPRLV